MIDDEARDDEDVDLDDGEDADLDTDVKDGEDADDDNGDQGEDGEDGDDADDLDPQRLIRTLRRQRKSEKKLKAERNRYKRELAELRKGDGEDSDPAKLDAKLKERDEVISDLTTKYQALKVNSELTAAGIPRERIKAALAIAEIEFDDDGEPVDIADAIEELREEHAYLFDTDQGDTGKKKQKRREGSGNAGAGGRKGDSSDVVLSAEERDIARRSGMTPDEYIKWNKPRT